MLRLPAVVAAAFALVAAAAADARITRTSIAGVRVEMSPKQVRAVRGTPARVIRSGPWRVGRQPLTYVYRHPRLRVSFLLGGDRLYAYTLRTTDPSQAMANGVRVGMTLRELRRRLRLSCRTSGPVTYCGEPGAEGAGGVTFTIARGRVAEIQVSEPVF